MELAHSLGMSLQRCMRETTSTEFNDWCWFLSEQRIRRDPLHWYLARIAMEVRASAQPKKRWNIRQFLINFTNKKTENTPQTEQARQEYLKNSKAFWQALAGAFSEKRDPPKRKRK